jgi:CHAT domain-containing protein/tetratricopeptide (TPR) repeat protein
MGEMKSAGISPEYWLTVCRGREAAAAWIASRAEGRSAALTLLGAFPILGLPQFPSAVDRFGFVGAGAEIHLEGAEAGRCLESLLSSIERNDTETFAVINLRLGYVLSEEKAGDVGLNLAAAIVSFDIAAHAFDETHDRASALAHGGVARMDLAELGVEPLANFEAAVSKLQDAAKLFGAGENMARSLVHEGIARSELGRMGVGAIDNLNAARCLYDQAMIMYNTRSGKGQCLLNKGIATVRLAEMGVGVEQNPREAIELYREAIELYREARAFFDESQEIARALMSEGNTHARIAQTGLAPRENLSLAVALYDETEDLLESGPDLGALLTMRALAHFYLARFGDDPQANLGICVGLCRQAETMGLTGGDLARCLVNRANAISRLADLRVSELENLHEAVVLYGRAARVFNAGLEVAMCLMNAANALTALAERNIAPIEMLERSLDMYREAETFATVGATRAECQFNMANTYVDLGERRPDPQPDYTSALALYQVAISGLAAPGDRAACLSAEAAVRGRLANLGVDSLANVTMARRLHRESIDAFLAFGSGIDTLRALRNFGAFCLQEELWPEAYSAFSTAINLLEEVSAHSATLGDRRAWMERNSVLFDGAVHACLVLQRPTEALEFLERGRSRAIADLVHIAEARPRTIPDSTWEEYRRYRLEAENLDWAIHDFGTTGFLALDDAPGLTGSVVMAAEMRERRQELRQAITECEEAIRAVAPEFLPVATPLKFEELRQVANRAGRPLIYPWFSESQSLMFAVTPAEDGSELETSKTDACGLVLIPMNGVSKTDIWKWLFGQDPDHTMGGWVGAHLEHRAASGENNAYGSHTAFDRWIAQMDQVLSNLGHHIANPLRSWMLDNDWHAIVLIPGAQLGFLPLHAAQWTDLSGNTQCAIDQLDVVYAPSGWVYDRCERRQKETWSPLLIVTDPHRPNSTSSPFSIWEGKTIEALVRGTQGVAAASTLSGTRATAGSVQTMLGSHQSLHLACHGWWFPDDPLASSILLADNESLSLTDIISDEYLTRMRLVVMSACETALGYTPGGGGEEYLGLPAGFITAGVASVVGSLWLAPDVASALLMTRFHGMLMRNEYIDAALRSSQSWLRNLTTREALRIVGEIPYGPDEQETRWSIALEWLSGFADDDFPFQHPFFWAGFVAFGSPAPLGVLTDDESAETWTEL